MTATLARPWLAAQTGAEHSWRFDPKLSGAVCSPTWATTSSTRSSGQRGSVATEVAAIRARSEAGLETVTAAALRLTGGVPAMIGVSGVTPGSTFELCYYGDEGWLRATDVGLDSDPGRRVAVQPLPQAAESIDGNFVSAVLRDTPLCCSAEEALDTVRLLEAIGRSVATGQLVRLA
ncbi:MAG: hypothetical protein U0794_10485 [Isosphaeraceae bacterium]